MGRVAWRMLRRSVAALRRDGGRGPEKYPSCLSETHSTHAGTMLNTKRRPKKVRLAARRLASLASRPDNPTPSTPPPADAGLAAHPVGQEPRADELSRAARLAAARLLRRCEVKPPLNALPLRLLPAAAAHAAARQPA